MDAPLQDGQEGSYRSRLNSYPPDAMAACSRRDSLRNPHGEARRSILEVPRIPISIVGELKVDSLGGVGGEVLMEMTN